MGSDMGDVLAFPLPLAGHVNPIMFIVNRLIERGISVTVVVPENSQAIIAKYLDERGHGGTLLTVELVLSTEGLQYEGILDVAVNFERVCEPFFRRIVSEQESGGRLPKCIIADQFGQSWIHRLATILKIPRYITISSNASYGYFMSKFSSLVDKGLLDNPDEDPMIDLPGGLRLPLSGVAPSARQNPQLFSNCGDEFGEAASILVNTFHQLESPQIEAFQAQLTATTNPGRKAPKVLTIGPMLPLEYFSVVPSEGRADSSCVQWLDTRPPSSVLYIAFGSVVILSPDEVQELAYGLEASHQSFLWVIRTHSNGGEMAAVAKLLPEGFQTRTKDQGLIFTEFAPQLQILSHPAIRGFFTHCGWNSSLESICRGVPMIGWPMMAEQSLSCRLLVDHAKVAIDVEPCKQRTLDRKSVEKAINKLMVEPEGQELRKSVLELQRQARASIGIGGSSHTNFETLVADMKGRMASTFSDQAS